MSGIHTYAVCTCQPCVCVVYSVFTRLRTLFKISYSDVASRIICALSLSESVVVGGYISRFKYPAVAVGTTEKKTRRASEIHAWSYILISPGDIPGILVDRARRRLPAPGIAVSCWVQQSRKYTKPQYVCIRTRTSWYVLVSSVSDNYSYLYVRTYILVVEVRCVLGKKERNTKASKYYYYQVVRIVFCPVRLIERSPQCGGEPSVERCCSAFASYYSYSWTK